MEVAKQQARNAPAGLGPAWVTFLVVFFGLSLAFGFVALFGMNVPFVLAPDRWASLTVHRLSAGPALFDTYVILVITPVMGLEATPLAFPLHLLALSILYTRALEGTRDRPLGLRLVVLLGLAFVLTAPVPGLYSLLTPFPQILTFWPALHAPVLLFFHHPLVRSTFFLFGYGLPVLALALAQRVGRAPSPRRPPSSVLAVLLAAVGLGGMLLVLTKIVVLQLAGLVVTWGTSVAAIVVWALYYRPRLGPLRFPSSPGLEGVLPRWRSPAAAFVGLALLMLLVTALPPVDAFVDGNASAHHGQHVVLFAAGLLQGAIVHHQAASCRRAPGLPGRMARFVYVGNRLYNPRGLVGVAFAVGAVGWWHTPFFWELALRTEFYHYLEHAFVIAAGGALGASLFVLSRGAQQLLLLGGSMAMGLLSLALWFAGTPVYASYPLEQLAALGRIHFLLGAPLTVYAVGSTTAALVRGSFAEGPPWG